MIGVTLAFYLTSLSTAALGQSRSWTFEGSITSAGFGHRRIGITSGRRLWVLDPLDWEKNGIKFQPIGPELPEEYRLVNCGGYSLLFRQGAIVVGNEIKDSGAPRGLITQRIGRGGPVGWTKLDPATGSELDAWAPAFVRDGALTLLETPILPSGAEAKEIQVAGRAMGSIVDSRELFGAVAKKSNDGRGVVVPVRWVDGLIKPYPLTAPYAEAFPIYRADTYNFFGVVATRPSLLSAWQKWSFDDPGPFARPAIFAYDRVASLPMPELTADESKRKCVYAGVCKAGVHDRFAAGHIFLYSPHGDKWAVERSEPCAWVNRKPIPLGNLLPAGFAEAEVVAAEDTGLTESEEGKVARVWLTGRIKGKPAVVAIALIR